MNNKQSNTKKTNTAIKNPTDTIGGKILIWVLIGLMAVLPLATLIYALCNL